MSNGLVHRFRKWVVGAIAGGAALYLAGSLWAGFDEVGAALQSFDWRWALPVLVLTLLNYGLRFLKWHYLLRLLGVSMPWGVDAWNFAAGLAMVISPGKAGELLKPYVVRAYLGTPMARTVPALVTERLTDGIAMLILAGLGVTTYAADKANYLIIPAVLVAGGLGVLASTRLSMAILGALEHVPGIGGLAHKLEEMYLSMRTCVAPFPLLVAVVVSVLAWGAECLGLLLVFEGLHVDTTLGVCTFLYAFATVAGGAMPGGLGVADGAIAGGAVALIPGIAQSTGVAAALLIRTATLWFGVGIGAVALLRVASLLDGGLDLSASPSTDPIPPAAP